MIHKANWHRRVKWGIIAGGIFASACCFAAADEPQIAQQKRQQQATVALARQLIADVLDIQMRQFTDNGLDTLPVFADIRQTRVNIDKVTEDDMRAIIEALNQAQHVTGPGQMELLRQARSQARGVIAVLMQERERLRQRLKVAHLQEQVSQLIAQQQRVQVETRQLPTIASEHRDRATLSALENQRDTHTLFDRLTESLETIQNWETEEGNAATESLKQLRDEGTTRLFQNVERELFKGTINQAAIDQDTIIAQMSRVLDRFQSAQGLEPLDPSSILEKVRGLLEEQRHLAEETQTADATNQEALDQLSQQQNDIHQHMDDLNTSGNELAGGKPWLETAKSASMRAEEQLFEGNRDAAVEQQREVVRNLDQLENLLKAAESLLESPLAADALAAQMKQLEQLDENLNDLAERQEQVVSAAANDPQAAQQRQQEVASGLSQEAKRESLPQEVEQAVERAADTAQQATQTMTDQSPQNASARSAAAQDAQRSIQAAQAQTAARLQAARHALQQVNVQSLTQSTSSPGSQSVSQTSQKNSSSDALGPRRGASPRPVESERTDPRATSSMRRVGDAERTQDQRDTIAGREFADAPWFARLPAELREAIRMQGRRQPPRGYEQRLRRYFESADK